MPVNRSIGTRTVTFSAAAEENSILLIYNAHLQIMSATRNNSFMTRKLSQRNHFLPYLYLMPKSMFMWILIKSIYDSKKN